MIIMNITKNDIITLLLLIIQFVLPILPVDYRIKSTRRYIILVSIAIDYMC